MSSKKSSFVQRFNDSEFRRHYIKYKVMVEHRALPSNLLRELPPEIAFEMVVSYEEKNENYLHKKA